MRPTTLLAAALFLSPAAHAAGGVIETPINGENTTGIAVIRGWHCTAKVVTIKIDNYAPLTAGSGTERLDAVGACGQPNSGYSLLYNFNVLPTGPHTIVAFADGTEFARVAFNTMTLGSEFLTGKASRQVLRNFPDMNQSVVVEWQEGRQNFSMIAKGTGTAYATAPIGGTYYGAAGTQCATDPQPSMADERFARFDVSMTTDNQAMSVAVRYADGFQCALSGAVANGNNGYFVVASPASTCGLGTDNLRVEVNGLRIKGVIGSVPGTGCFTTRAIYGARAYSVE